jgi:hypothetical protein
MLERVVVCVSAVPPPLQRWALAKLSHTLSQIVSLRSEEFTRPEQRLDQPASVAVEGNQAAARAVRVCAGFCVKATCNT